jgi:short subunit dehydrogenase-like uncharacterized protein
MPDVLLFGATGMTGRLVAHALRRKEIPLALAGRNEAKLGALARELGEPPIHVVDAASPGDLVSALDGCGVLLSCVGPFTLWGETAVRAALEARVNYLDSCGEGAFVRHLVDEFDGPATRRGVVLVPAAGFEEVPGDLAATLATENLDAAGLTLTYAIPTTASPGTVRSALRVLAAPGRFIEGGRRVAVAAGSRRRWAPLPPPSGPRPSIAAPLAELELAPLHLPLQELQTYVAVGPAVDFAARHGLTSLTWALRWGPVRDALGAALTRVLPSPFAGGGGGETVRGDEAVGGHSEADNGSAASEGWWTILAEARSGSQWRNVMLTGRDVYGLSARLLAAGAAALAASDTSLSGVLSPVQALGTDFWHKELIDWGVSIEIYEGRWPPGTAPERQ